MLVEQFFALIQEGYSVLDEIQKGQMPLRIVISLECCAVKIFQLMQVLSIHI